MDPDPFSDPQLWFKVLAWCAFLGIIYSQDLFLICRPCWQRIEPVRTATRCLTTRCCAASTTSTTFASQPRSRSVTSARKYSSQVEWPNVKNERLNLQEKFTKSSFSLKCLGFLQKWSQKHANLLPKAGLRIRNPRLTMPHFAKIVLPFVV